MVTSETITVYGFLTYEHGYERPRLAPFKATRQAIERTYGGQVVEGTSEEVPVDELDDAGRFRRTPTGWGELDGPA